ncbi:PQQ-dependent sugar dehydrogenase [Salininema proteolyticum]|uniref:PQQ-dependent sugar dehydrogenase n=1 Tax=Salininema proteolyticum TaxID=1607685 RepID=A0ABV8TUF6_9ACTN
MKPVRIAVFLVLVFVAAACGGGGGASASEGWSIPWGIAPEPGGDPGFVLVTEREAFTVTRVEVDGGDRTVLGRVPEVEATGGEGGLMGVALAPDWDGSAVTDVYFMHTASEGNRIAVMDFDGESLSGYRVVVDGIAKSRFHNGGRIAFGPDGYLYAGTGDAQDPGLARDPGSLNGKILRVDREGEPVEGNPFGNEVYSLGHRNPQGLAWDGEGRLWSSELGENTWDELNLIVAGGDYGWPACEGACEVEGTVDPVRSWSTSEASPSGLAFSDGTLYMAALRGQRLWVVDVDGERVEGVSAMWEGRFGRLRAVAVVGGELWVSTSNSDGPGGEEPGADRVVRHRL